MTTTATSGTVSTGTGPVDAAATDTSAASAPLADTSPTDAAAVELRRQAWAFLAALPASVTMPAGTGKTHLLAATVAQIHAHVHAGAPGDGGQDGKRVLVLTHTNAGMHAIRRRLDRMGAAEHARVSTITAFAFELARAYPRLGGIDIPPVPDWSDTPRYQDAALRVSASPHLQAVLGASFSHLFVDEYQDCSQQQHDIVLNLAAAVPATGVLGDPLQAIFGFSDPLIAWTTVQASFPDHRVPQNPWRWSDGNDALGAWLLALRQRLVAGEELDLSRGTPPAVTFRPSSADGRALGTVTRTLDATWDSVVVICGVAPGMARYTASRLHGYSVMEDVAGTEMRKQLTQLGRTNPASYPLWLLETVKLFFTGHAKLDSPLRDRLVAGKSVVSLKRDGHQPTLEALDAVRDQPDLATVASSMAAVVGSGATRLHSHEAWYDMINAIRATADTITSTQPTISGPDELSERLVHHLSATRDRLRHTGRPERRLIVSRTTLIKGLEYDHVVIANIAHISDVCNLYVALTRARKTVTILGAQPAIRLKSTPEVGSGRTTSRPASPAAPPSTCDTLSSSPARRASSRASRT